MHGIGLFRRGIGALGALSFAAFGLAACGSSPSATPPTTSSATSSTTTSTTTSTLPSGPHNCSTAQLRVSAGMSSGAAGTIGQIVLFENAGSTSCLLHGFPGVAGLDSAGNQVVQATRELNGAPFTGSTGSLPTVTLATGETASAIVFGSDVPVGSATSCATYAALLVTPPNAYQSVRVQAQLPACSGLRVGPVYAGTGGGLG